MRRTIAALVVALACVGAVDVYAGRGTEYARGGANRQYNTVAYLQPGNLQAARSYQLDILFRF